MAFNAIILKNGETRSDYIRRRYNEGATEQQIFAEINGPALYSGPDGKQWTMKVVEQRVEKIRAERRARAKAEPATPAPAPAVGLDAAQRRVDSIALSPEEKAELDREAEEQVAEERRASLRSRYLKETRARLAAQDGLKTGNPWLDELVEHVVDLPGDPRQCHLVNGRAFFNGQRVTINGSPPPRHVVLSMRETEHRARVAEARREGKPADFYTRAHMDRNTGEHTGPVSNDRVSGGRPVLENADRRQVTV